MAIIVVIIRRLSLAINENMSAHSSTQSAIITVISGAFLAGSVDSPVFILFRFFSGAGGNMLSATVPIWMAEVVPARKRATLVDLHGASYLFGYMITAWIGCGFSTQTPRGGSHSVSTGLGSVFSVSSGRDGHPLAEDLLITGVYCILALQCLAPLNLLSCIYWLPKSPQ